jgi:hypothetical protein
VKRITLEFSEQAYRRFRSEIMARMVCQSGMTAGAVDEIASGISRRIDAGEERWEITLRTEREEKARR